jgi:hypothetical protein
MNTGEIASCLSIMRMQLNAINSGLDRAEADLKLGRKAVADLKLELDELLTAFKEIAERERVGP